MRRGLERVRSRYMVRRTTYTFPNVSLLCRAMCPVIRVETLTLCTKVSPQGSLTAPSCTLKTSRDPWTLKVTLVSERAVLLEGDNGGEALRHPFIVGVPRNATLQVW